MSDKAKGVDPNPNTKCFTNNSLRFTRPVRVEKNG